MNRPDLLRRRSRREWWAALIVLAGLVAFVLVVYGVVVLGAGELLGRGSGDVGLSIVATAVVALAFDPVQSWLDGAATRFVHGGLASPYDVLRAFSETAANRYAADELPTRMAQVLAEGTGAAWAQLWLVVGGRPFLAATWPPDAPEVPTATPDLDDHPGPGRLTRSVRDGDDLLAIFVLQSRPNVSLTAAEEGLFAELADQSRLVLRGARLRAERARRATELSARADELRRARHRLVDVQDDQRRLLERDIHDGAQQHLVALAVNLRLAQTVAKGSPERADRLLAAQEDAAREAERTLVSLARGIYPALLVDEGLAAALTAATSASPVPVHIVADRLGRFALPTEVAAYFCCLEAVQNAVKHAGASRIRVGLSGDDGVLDVQVEDDGAGFDIEAAMTGSGLRNMRERLESVDGTLAIESTTRGTRVLARLPHAGGG